MEIIIEDNKSIRSSFKSTRGLKSKSNFKNQKKMAFTPTQASESNENVIFDCDEAGIMSFDSIVNSNNSNDISFPKQLNRMNSMSNSPKSKSFTNSFQIFEEEYPDILESLRKFSHSTNVKINEKSICNNMEFSSIDAQSAQNETSLSKTKEDTPVHNKTEQFEEMTNIQEINDFNEYTNECMKIIARMTVPDISTLKNRYVTLPFADDIGLNKKRLAIFDLDETLIHCELKDIESAQQLIEVIISSSMRKTIGLNIRPLLKEELTRLKEKYYLIIYTASQQKYADAVLDQIDPNNELFSYRLYRNNCTLIKVDDQSLYIKDLRIFKNISMNDMVIIDNSILSFAFHLNNGIPILPYYRGNDEIELNNLRILLEKLANKPNFQTELKLLMNLEEFVEKCKHDEDTEDLDTIEEQESSNASIENSISTI